MPSTHLEAVAVAVRGAESLLPGLPQNNILNIRIRNGNKEEKGQEHRDKANKICWKGLFAYRNFQGEKSEAFVCYSFQIQTSFVIQTWDQIATNIFSDKPPAFQTLATGTIIKSGIKEICITQYLSQFKLAI